MKKNWIIITFLFIISSVLSAQIKQEELIGKGNRLYISIVGETRDSAIYVEFKDEKTYTFCSPYGGYLWGTYNYKIEGNTIYLAVTNDEKPFGIEELNKLFSSKNSNQFVDFVYDAQFYTFSVQGGFRHENVLLTNKKYTKLTPQGTECIIGKTKVIKKSGYLVPTENLKVRKEPNTQAETGIIDYRYEFLCLANDEYRGTGKYNADYEITFWDDYGSPTFPILLAGMIRQFDAITIEKQTIDGITAPWYRISFTDNDEGATRYYWVFGGYIKEVDNPETKEYEKLFIYSALQKGLINKIKKR